MSHFAFTWRDPGKFCYGLSKCHNMNCTLRQRAANFLRRQWSDFWNLFENYLKTIWKLFENMLKTIWTLFENLLEIFCNALSINLMVLTFELHVDCNNSKNVAFRVYVTGSRKILLRLVQLPQHELHIETKAANFLKRQWSDFWNLFENYLKTWWKPFENVLKSDWKHFAMHWESTWWCQHLSFSLIAMNPRMKQFEFTWRHPGKHSVTD